MLLSLISTLSISPCLSLSPILIPGPHRQAGQESRLLPQVCGEYYCSLSVFLSLSFYFPFTRTLYFYSPLHLASLPLPPLLSYPPPLVSLTPLSSSLSLPLSTNFLSYPSFPSLPLLPLSYPFLQLLCSKRSCYRPVEQYIYSPSSHRDKNGLRTFIREQLNTTSGVLCAMCSVLCVSYGAMLCLAS